MASARVIHGPEHLRRSSHNTAGRRPCGAVSTRVRTTQKRNNRNRRVRSEGSSLSARQAKISMVCRRGFRRAKRRKIVSRVPQPRTVLGRPWAGGLFPLSCKRHPKRQNAHPSGLFARRCAPLGSHGFPPFRFFGGRHGDIQAIARSPGFHRRCRTWQRNNAGAAGRKRSHPCGCE